MREATIEHNDAPSEPNNADTEPPPGAGLFVDISSISSDVDKLTSLSPSDRIAYSIIFLLGLNFSKSFNPNDCTATSIISFSDTPSEEFCFFK